MDKQQKRRKPMFQSREDFIDKMTVLIAPHVIAKHGLSAASARDMMDWLDNLASARSLKLESLRSSEPPMVTRAVNPFGSAEGPSG